MAYIILKMAVNEDGEVEHERLGPLEVDDLEEADFVYMLQEGSSPYDVLPLVFQEQEDAEKVLTALDSCEGLVRFW